MPTNKKRQAEPTANTANKRRAGAGASVAAPTTRMTRSAYKKLNQAGEKTAKLEQGLPMETRRRRKQQQSQPAATTVASCKDVSSPQPPTVDLALGVTAGGAQVRIPMEIDDDAASRPGSLDDAAGSATSAETERSFDTAKQAGLCYLAGVEDGEDDTGRRSFTTVVYATGVTPDEHQEAKRLLLLLLLM
ncbi:hypothetical protein M406DRAFT_328245 [Cryphonectria parasitica EP155]|uniref:Uncharacterized protein n=1 Tax=Cryphonectria parasitica (strain ATCC 38755 / EP155) TaxID=660469 RepID=A0A9P4Y5N0_CRYP1|nr:uncharacterized protein M406DRAFT_328245 [Cryphonectria parasitica EP155]KAF3767146.1 hypothetical protein M406DRAFT_328245 [Cryphonectria parasitica EP155]